MKHRIEMVDALRGFAVLAILLVHNIEHFIFPVYPTDVPEWLNNLDTFCSETVFMLFAGKAYAIFSLLFGFSFYIQYENQRVHGKDFGYRYLWRLVGLLFFATLNAAFFPAGDVLLLYAVMGVVLFLVRKWSDKAVLMTAIFFLLQPIEWYHYIMSLVDSAHQLPDYGVGAMYDKVGEVVKGGNLWEFLWCNITLGQKASFMWAVGAGRVMQTAGLFLIGLYIGRKKLFLTSESNIHIWKRIFYTSAIAFLPLYTIHSICFKEHDVAMIQQTIGTILDMWHKLAFTFVLVSLFVLQYQKPIFKNKVSALQIYGRMSLTNYVSQSFIGAIIYFPIGLYLAPYCGYTLSLVVAMVMFLMQMLFCKWWLSSHKQGPLEYLWRRWTWMNKSA